MIFEDCDTDGGFRCEMQDEIHLYRETRVRHHFKPKKPKNAPISQDMQDSVILLRFRDICLFCAVTLRYRDFLSEMALLVRDF